MKLKNELKKRLIIVFAPLMDQHNTFTAHMQLAMFKQQSTILPELQDIIYENMSLLLVEKERKNRKRNKIIREMMKLFYNTFVSYLEHETIQHLIKNVSKDVLSGHFEWMEEALCGLKISIDPPSNKKNELIKKKKMDYFGDFVVQELWDEALNSLLNKDEDTILAEINGQKQHSND